MKKLTTEQVEALSPDTDSLKKAKDLMKKEMWLSLHLNQEMIWGECKGSGSKSYQVQVNLSTIKFNCTCPSRKYPCKHVLSLLLFFVSEQQAFKEKTLPEWIKLTNSVKNNSKKQSADTAKIAAIEKIYGELPQRYKDFITNKEYEIYDGLLASNLPLMGGSYGLEFQSFPRIKYFTENASSSVEFVTVPKYCIPLASFENQDDNEIIEFLLVDIRKEKCPVLLWWSDNKMYEVAESLEHFLKNLTEKGEKTPEELWEDKHKKGEELYEKGEYENAVSYLTNILKDAPAYEKKHWHERQTINYHISGCFNFRALSYRKLKKYEQATADWEQAIPYGFDYLKLNLLDTWCYHIKNYIKTIELCTELDIYLGKKYNFFHCKKAYAFANLMLGHKDEAIKIYKEIQKEFLRKDEEKINEVIKELTEESEGKGKEIISWFGKVKAVAGEIKKKNRDWWDNLEENWKKNFSKELETESEPTDDNLIYLINLESIYLDSKFPIKSLEPLKKFNNLKEISLGYMTNNHDIYDYFGEKGARKTWLVNYIPIIESVKEFKKLTRLKLKSNAIENIMFLKDMKNLEYLELGGNKISDLTPLENLINLKTLYINENKIKSLEPLKNLKKLERLWFRKNKITSLKPLKNLTNLKNLFFCKNNPIKTLEGIENFTHIEELNLAKTDISDFSGLKNFKNLKKLNISGTPAEDFSFLEYLKNLEEINCSETKIKDLSILLNCKKLKKIDCRKYDKIKIEGFIELAKLTDLEDIEIKTKSVGNQVIAEFGKLRPDIEISA